jgi:hypothetical protein
MVAFKTTPSNHISCMFEAMNSFTPAYYNGKEKSTIYT